MDNILKRALAGTYPYDPQYLHVMRHPSQRYRSVMIERRLPDIALRQTRADVLRDVERDVDHVLAGQQALHFEIVPDDDGHIVGWICVIPRAYNDTTDPEPGYEEDWDWEPEYSYEEDQGWDSI